VTTGDHAVGARLLGPGRGREESRADGRRRRVDVPRSAHAGWRAPPDRPDPITLLEARHVPRVPELVPIRVGRMMVSPFTFLRGAAEVMAHDLASTPVSGLEVQACGDAHVLNFGIFATPERHLVFDVNDFDETLPGPWEWDVKRLAASMDVACRTLGFEVEVRHAAVRATVRSYRDHVARLSKLSPLETWYEQVDVEAVLALAQHQDPATVAEAERSIRKARHHTSVTFLPNVTELVDGRRRIVDDPPLVQHAEHVEGIAHEMMSGYLASLTPERRRLLQRYEVVDAARKVVGVGSVGTHCSILLLMDHDDGAPLFLQMKEAEASVLERYVRPSDYAHRGERVVQGQRLVQAASDTFLGWTHGRADRDYYVRQMRDMKGSVALEMLTPEGIAGYGALCGWALGRAHSRSGEPVAISSYLGSGDQFVEAIVAFAHDYADQTERDHAALVQAVADGRLEAVAGR